MAYSHAGLDAPGAKARQEAVEALRGSTDVTVLEDLSRVLHDDANANVRRSAADVLAGLGQVAGPTLRACLEKAGEEPFVHAGAASSLGVIRYTDAVPALELAALAPGSLKYQITYIDALRSIGSPTAAEALARVAGCLETGPGAAMAVVSLGRIGGPGAAAAVVEASSSSDAKVRKAAATAITDLKAPETVSVLSRLVSDEESGVRLRAVEHLGVLEDSGVVVPLVERLLFDEDEKVRLAASGSLAARSPSPGTLDALVAALRSSKVARRDVDIAGAAAALAPAAKAGYPDGTTLFDRLVGAAADGDDRMTALLADLLTACCGEDADAAADHVNAYEARNPGQSESLTRLRVAMGGKRALDPLLRQLQHDLKQYFQDPISELNTETREGWRQASDRARQAFTIRVGMSVAVFVVGTLLVAASSVRFFMGDLNTTAAWGTGGSLVGGLTAMLAVTYSGPLRDVQQSVRDLGSATAAFIGYVHQVLQISHTFSALYLRDRITFEETAKASKLLQAATNQAVQSLSADPTGLHGDAT